MMFSNCRDMQDFIVSSNFKFKMGFPKNMKIFKVVESPIESHDLEQDLRQDLEHQSQCTSSKACFDKRRKSSYASLSCPNGISIK
jgi:hypothetical protein